MGSLLRTLSSRRAASGNPRGRPKKALDFDQELIRESESFITINENGQRKRISKHKVVVKQLVKQAMTGSPQAQRIYLDHRQQALERLALVAGSQPGDLGKDIKAEDMTDDQLARIAAKILKETEQVSGKGHLSNTE